MAQNTATIEVKSILDRQLRNGDFYFLFFLTTEDFIFVVFYWMCEEKCFKQMMAIFFSFISLGLLSLNSSQDHCCLKPCLCLDVVFMKEKRRLAIRNAAQQWEGVRACMELAPTTGTKEEISPENSPNHSPAQTNGVAQDPSPEEPRCTWCDACWVNLTSLFTVRQSINIKPIAYVNISDSQVHILHKD